jgi:hypothetical protein
MGALLLKKVIGSVQHLNTLLQMINKITNEKTKALLLSRNGELKDIYIAKLHK